MAAKKEAAANEQQATTQATPAAEAEDIIAKAKAEAAAIVAEAQAKAKETLEAAKETAPAAPNPNDLVPIRLYKDNDKWPSMAAASRSSAARPCRCPPMWRRSWSRAWPRTTPPQTSLSARAAPTLPRPRPATSN